MRKPICVLAALAGLPAGTAAANTSHEGWPPINGMLLMNKTDAPRPLDARPGHDPLGGTDRRYSCDAIHKRGACQRRFVRTHAGVVVTSRSGHNELLGGHGNDAIYAGPWGDVLWADYKPSGQPTSQVDRVLGNNGKDFIYASHGTNMIAAGGGDDWVKAHFGRGTIDCGGGRDLLYISRRAQRHYKIRSCERISHKTLGR
jgi:hypothetical protein